MAELLEVRVPPETTDIHDEVIRQAMARAGSDGSYARIIRKSVDARGKRPVFVFQVSVWDDEEEVPEPVIKSTYQDVRGAPRVHIVGAGPAGYFAALRCLELGLKPVIIERGKDVRNRRRDLRAIQQFGLVDENSNYCFGEGGAGTYSDGKLYTRSTKRGNVQKILSILVEHGAHPDILIDAHPHIGSNKLPKIIANIRATVEVHGGEIRFDSCVTKIESHKSAIRELILADGERIAVDQVILATGHSARDVYRLLQDLGIAIEFKPFALGVRIEHPQPLIDKIQYGRTRGEYLPPASYRLACQVGHRGVFSFCMCPGGLVVPTATAPGEIVVNGMSLSRRDSAYANAGTVVSVGEEDIRAMRGIAGPLPPLTGVELQHGVEQACFDLGDGTQRAPGQRLMDFLNDRVSQSLPDCSYIPGLFSADINGLLPGTITETLKSGIRVFGEKMPGYLTNEAVVIATESRTSAPVRIPRDHRTFMHPDLDGLFPSGEGAGYAGGIVSAAIDGQNVASAVASYLGVT